MPLRNLSLDIDNHIYQTALSRARLEGRPLDAVLAELLAVYAGVAPARMRTYTVKRGDSLARIARQLYGDPHQYPVIQHANQLNDPGRIWVGQVLVIPPLAADRTETLPSPGLPPPPEPRSSAPRPEPAPPPEPEPDPPLESGPDPCAPTGEHYLTLPVDEASLLPAETGQADAAAPWALKLESLFVDGRRPHISGGAYTLLQQQSSRRPQAGQSVDFVVTQVDVAARSGELVRAPRAIDRTGRGYAVVVTQAEADQVVLRYLMGTDKIVASYAIKIEGICVDPTLLGLYKQIHASHRRRLPALRPEQPFGRVQDSRVRLMLQESRPPLALEHQRRWWAG